jgi:hypothetical protein
MTPACRHPTAACVVLPARAYRVWPTGSPAILCEPCAAELRSMGLSLELEDERPEWVRRAAERRLPAKELSGAGR